MLRFADAISCVFSAGGVVKLRNYLNGLQADQLLARDNVDFATLPPDVYEIIADDGASSGMENEIVFPFDNVNG